MTEQLKHQQHEQQSQHELHASQAQEKLASVEARAAQSRHEHNEQIEHIRASIEKTAVESSHLHERQHAQHEQQPTHHHYITKKIKAEQYKQTIKQVQQRLPKAERTFSTFVHRPSIEAISEVGAKTVARPSGILGGALFALIGSTTVLLVARRVGFEVPNSIFAILFICGFMGGLVAEVALRFLRNLSPKHRKQRAEYRS